MVTHTIERVTCPAEVTAAVPPPVVLPDGATLSFDAAGGTYVGARFRREELLGSRLADAARQCPGAPAVAAKP